MQEEVVPNTVALKNYLAFPIRVLKITGCWPEKNPPLLYQIYSIIVAIVLLTDTLTCVAALFTDLDYDTGVYVFCLVLAHLSGVVKMIFVRARINKANKVMEFFENPLFTIDATEEIIIPMRVLNFFRKLLFFFIISTSTLTIVNPLLSGMTIFPVPFDINKQPISVYIGICVFQVWGTNLIATIVASFDGFGIMVMGIAITQLHILKTNIHKAFEWNSSDSSIPGMNNEEVNQKLKQCVVHHIVIEEYINAIEDMFNIPLLLQMTLSLIQTVFIVYCFFVTPSINNFPLMLKLCCYFMSVMVELSIYCVPGDEITRQSSEIGDACYMAEWTECDPSVRQTLFIIMERAKRPFRLSANKFIYLSLDTLVGVLKSSFSYFTVLRNMYSK